MKSQIFTGIALLVAGVVTVEFNEKQQAEVQLKEVKVVTTEELIQKSSLQNLTEEIESKQDSVSLMIREKVKDRVIDSVIVPKDSVKTN